MSSELSLADFDLEHLTPRSREILEKVALPLSDGDRRGDVAAVAEDLGLETREVRELMKELRAELQAQRDGAKLPELSHDDYEALRESIRQYGQLVPVVETVKDGTVIDGRHRLRACEELGIDPWIVRVPESTLRVAARDADLIANVVRRHLTATQRRKVVAAELIRDPDRSDREIALMFGMSHMTVGAVRREFQERGQVANLATGDNLHKSAPAAPTVPKTARELLIELVPRLREESNVVIAVLSADLIAETNMIGSRLAALEVTADGLVEMTFEEAA